MQHRRLGRQQCKEPNERIGHHPDHQSARAQKEKLENDAAPPGRSQRDLNTPGGVGEKKKRPSQRQTRVAMRTTDVLLMRGERAEQAASPVNPRTGISLLGQRRALARFQVCLLAQLLSTVRTLRACLISCAFSSRKGIK